MDSTAMSRERPMTLARAIVAYGVCLGVAIGLLAPLVVLAFRSFGLGVALGVAVTLHLTLGVALSRTVLRQLVQWHFMATLADVAREKVKAVVLWPVVYPVLFLQLALSRHL